jgi:hypothetical protein
MTYAKLLSKKIIILADAVMLSDLYVFEQKLYRSMTKTLKQLSYFGVVIHFDTLYLYQILRLSVTLSFMILLVILIQVWY